jgi:4-hydroxybenzoyl-CoA reductase subunit beta
MVAQDEGLSGVVPAKAGTHTRRAFDVSSITPQFEVTAYGSPPSRGRQQCALQSIGNSLMDALPEFELLRPSNLSEALQARAAHPDARLLGGGTDLMVNIRRGIVAPPVLIDMTGVTELREIKADARMLEIGAAVTLSELAAHPDVSAHYPVVAQAAHVIAGPTHRNMGTVGGNLCLDTRCIYYNQSEWWRASNHHCLKTTGTICHVAPKSRGVCFATFSGDLAPALLTLGAEVDLAAPAGRRTVPLASLYIGFARQDEPVTEMRGDGKTFLSLRAGEFVTAVRANNTPGLRSGYDKIRIRRSIEYPVCGVAVALRRDGDTLVELRVAVTGTNPRPVLLEGTDKLCGGVFDDRVLQGLDHMVRDQIMSMKTTFTPGHYRRRMAGVLAKRLVQKLFEVGRS